MRLRAMRSLSQLRRANKPHQRALAVALETVHGGNTDLADDHWTWLVGMFVRTANIKARPARVRMNAAEECAVMTFAAEILDYGECLMCTASTDDIIAQVLDSLHG